MKQKIIAVDIILPETVEFYGLTAKKQKVKGKIRVVTTEPVKMSKIELLFIGQINLHWRNTRGILRERMTASKTLRKFSKILIQNDILPSGVTDLDFEISIPGYVCPTFQSKFCEIAYHVSAKLMMPSKFQKKKSAHRALHIQKTIIPKEMALNTVSDFRVPRVEMTGKRSGILSWKLQVPQWACLDGSLVFDGVFHGFLSSIIINKIQIDVVQEEFYYYDVSCTNFKRRLITNTNLPSTYINPPLDTLIRFSFPLACLKKESNFVKKKNQDIQKDNFNHTLDSPFLTICHFARLLIYLQNGTSICIGAPFKVTPHLKPVCDNDLPSYFTALKEGKKLPSYTSVIENTIIPEITEIQQQNDQQMTQEMSGVGGCIDVISIGERNFEEFCVI